MRRRGDKARRLPSAIYHLSDPFQIRPACHSQDQVQLTRFRILLQNQSPIYNKIQFPSAGRCASLEIQHLRSTVGRSSCRLRSGDRCPQAGQLADQRTRWRARSHCSATAPGAVRRRAQVPTSKSLRSALPTKPTWSAECPVDAMISWWSTSTVLVVQARSHQWRSCHGYWQGMH